jgi:hypothetical protein
MIDLTDVEELITYDAGTFLDTGFDRSGRRWVRYRTEGENMFLCVGTSEDRYQDLINDRLTLREFLVQPESGKAYLYNSDSGFVSSLRVDSSEFLASRLEEPDVIVTILLPKPGTYLNLQ